MPKALIRTYSRGITLLIAVLSVMACLVSCDNEDNEYLDAYVNALGEFRTDHNGKVKEFCLDDGTTYTLTNDISGLTPDSIYRVQALYLSNGSKTTITQYAEVLAPMPRQIEADKQKTDAVGLSAIWNGGRYINLRLALLTQGGVHYFAFMDEGTEIHEDGTKIKRIKLYHDQNGNGTYYTRELIISCPVYQYEGELQSGKDSVSLTIQTFEGEKTLKTCLAF